MPEPERPSAGHSRADRSGIEPHPEQEERPEAPPAGRGAVLAVVVIAALLVALIALHLSGAISPQGH
jgi:hypothetical protein